MCRYWVGSGSPVSTGKLMVRYELKYSAFIWGLCVLWIQNVLFTSKQSQLPLQGSDLSQSLKDSTARGLVKQTVVSTVADNFKAIVNIQCKFLSPSIFDFFLTLGQQFSQSWFFAWTVVPYLYPWGSEPLDALLFLAYSCCSCLFTIITDATWDAQWIIPYLSSSSPSWCRRNSSSFIWSWLVTPDNTVAHLFACWA